MRCDAKAGDDRHGGSIVPMKNLLPATISDNSDEWLTWNNDAKDHLETQIPGARDILAPAEDAEKECRMAQPTERESRQFGPTVTCSTHTQTDKGVA